MATPSALTRSENTDLAAGPSKPPERSLNRQIVLEEDEYTAALSHIIARDFFPSLTQIGATNDYLDALRSDNPQLIEASVRRLVETTPRATPRAFAPSDTPRPAKRARYDSDNQPAGSFIDTSLSLDEFQARYTSEDNSSFTQIMDTENQRRRERWAWAWAAQHKVEARREEALELRERRLIEPAAGSAPGVKEHMLIAQPTNAGLITDGKEQDSSTSHAKGKGKPAEGDEKEDKDTEDMETAERLRMIIRDLDASKPNETIDVMAMKKDTRIDGVEAWKFKARNSLMFSPDADESPYHMAGKPPPPPDPKSIKHGSTRLPEQDNSSVNPSEPPSPTRSRIDAAIQGVPYRPRSRTSDPFSLVPAVPSPTPEELGPERVKQLMTWGTLNATPRIISRSGGADEDVDPPNMTFHIAGPTSREALSHRLSAKASKSLRAKADLMNGRTPGVSSRTPATSWGRTSALEGSMPPPSWTPRPSKSAAPGSLTPAAKRLLDRGTMGRRRAEAMEAASAWSSSKDSKTDLGRVRWTPTPGQRR
ncbi:hypothetical protein FISHEDRAFT_67022 [Fistulina hepatica ATCC 64428]|uniref:Nuclear protein DGCR14 n=1 Tax=Fistulina hepatica ATCC 64428 TaxID=1128425 RepID=A0A0D7A512_9AGAR|nr:hypothetical protein FISHEDRAFT_67022 [Fistulina hepatica ATCC 64428]